ncbi:peptidase M20 [Lottiidibacillus patelloidae]|uniref:Peptidase M20 n=1 Tax=Lottiidibacillus patelloidae TaxID=2670334 RepID=A0A263BTF9_9BACI|nr:dipeptidase [Lottiidibacillus patelloidae]OZM56667.1 peptidase M20 [Lottiidibacillus patelloidae]
MKEYIEQHKESFLEQLKELLRIPSISALPEHKEDVQAAASWLAKSLEDIGMENIEIIQTKGHPILYADWLHAEEKPTVLIYGHYDVQPIDPLELWETPPFEPTIRDEKIYARGATDDKGQMFLYLKAIELLMKKHGTLPVNIKFCIEGEEEIASPNLPPYIDKNKEKLAADAVLISDTSLIDKGQPAICTSLRGALAMELKVRTANTDLHSGSYGGAVPNAVHSIVKILDTFHDENGKIAVQDFYEGVPTPADTIKEEVAQIPFNEVKMKQELGIEDFFGEVGYTPAEQVSIRPTLEINGLVGGFHGEGFKTVIPCESSAKISCRLVGDQKPDKVYEYIERHITKNSPIGAKVELKKLITGDPVSLDSNDPMIQKAADAYEKVYGVRPLYPKAGGSIPIVEVFYRVLNTPVVLMGFGLPNENIHAPNEHFHLENFSKGIETICEYFQTL